MIAGKKYRILINSLIGLFVALLLLILTNFLIAKTSTIATEHMDIIGNISDDTLQIATSSQHLALVDQSNQAELSKITKEIQDYSAELDDYMAKLDNYEKKETAMEDFAKIWQVYRQKINALSSNRAEDRLALANYAQDQKGSIWDLMNVGYDTYLEETYRLASYSRYLQIFTLLALIGYLIFFVNFTFRRMHETDRAVEKAQKETADIMRTVNEGLFLIDRNMVIGENYSDKLEDIIHQKHIAGRTLLELLNGMISQKDLDTTKLFVEQLYNNWVVEDLIQDLNPLKQVLTTYMDKQGIADTRFLEFNFLRVMNEATAEVSKVFVSVVDVTNEVKLQNQILKDKEQHDKQIEMISYLMTANPEQLAVFIKETHHRFQRMNGVLKHEVNDFDNLQAKARTLLRETHSLKGDASAMKLGVLVSLAERQENELKHLLQQPTLKGNDFLKITIALDEMMDITHFIQSLMQRLHLDNASLSGLVNASDKHKLDSTNDTASPKVVETPIIKSVISHTQNYWQHYFTQYADDIAKRHQKQVQLTVIGFDNNGIDDAKMAVYKDITTQLIKNAIIHGIESPEARLAKGKPSMGQIELILQAVDGQHQLSIQDDGQGIDWQKIRDKAIEIGQITASQAEQLQPKDLVNLMFSSGLSTAEQQDEDAGRGMGMDIVRQLISEHHGKIGLNTKFHQFTQFTLRFPQN
ncbi:MULTISPECIES: ATP-binding protein [unclassified Moraxella]|uniref:ATP-binding protein n=1 Tax=unclassified Moraxella TaxID=2685852 RepID=UPI003AF5D65C